MRRIKAFWKAQEVSMHLTLLACVSCFLGGVAAFIYSFTI